MRLELGLEYDAVLRDYYNRMFFIVDMISGAQVSNISEEVEPLSMFHPSSFPREALRIASILHIYPDAQVDRITDG